MFKKSIILGLGVILASNFASANTSCIGIYEKAADKAYQDANAYGTILAGSGIVTGTLANTRDPIKSKVNPTHSLVSTGAGVSAGAVVAMHKTLNMSQLKDVVGVLKDAQTSKGLYLNKLTREVLRLQDLAYGSSVGPLEVAEVIRDLDSRGSFCQTSDLMSAMQIARLVHEELINAEFNN